MASSWIKSIIAVKEIFKKTAPNWKSFLMAKYGSFKEIYKGKNNGKLSSWKERNWITMTFTYLFILFSFI